MPPGTATTRVRPDNALIVTFDVNVAAPSKVFVEYEAKGVPRLRSATTGIFETRHSFSILRLRPETPYTYTAFAIDQSEVTAPLCSGTFTSGALPAGLADLEVRLVGGGATSPLTILDHHTGYHDSATDFFGYVAIDSVGAVVWYYENAGPPRPGQEGPTGGPMVGDIVQLPGWNLLYEDGHVLDTDNVIREISPFGELVRSSPSICETDPDLGGIHHGMTPNGHDGRVLYIGRQMVQIADGSLQVGDTIREWDPVTGRDVQRWSTFDAFDSIKDVSTDQIDAYGEAFVARRPSKLDMRECAESVSANNWSHANALACGSVDVLLSLRYFDAVISIDGDFGAVRWALAAEEHTPLASVADRIIRFRRPTDRFYRQHDVTQLPDGNILLFDNGYGRPESESGFFARALELEVDPERREARTVFEYRHAVPRSADFPEGFVTSWATGSARRLANGNTFIDFSNDGIRSQREGPAVFRLVEVDGEGRRVAEIHVSAPGKRFQYRAQPLDSLYGEYFF